MQVLKKSDALLYKNPLQLVTHSYFRMFYRRHLGIWSTNVIMEKILTSL